MIVRVELSMLYSVLDTVVLSGVVVWYSALWLVFLCFVLFDLGC